MARPRLYHSDEERRGALAENARRYRQRRSREHERLRKKAEKRWKPKPAAAAPPAPMAAFSWPASFPAGFRNQVVCGDARLLSAAIPDQSVALCFCDPVYERVEDYEWVGRECARVLMPGGSLIVQCGNSRRLACELALHRSGLEFVDLLAEVYPYGIGRLFKAKVFIGWKPYLWFSKGARTSGWVVNRLKVGGKTYASASKEIHPWGDSDQFATGLMRALLKAGDIVWDPFTGSGVVPLAAATLGFPFVAFEIDPATAAQAQARLAFVSPSPPPSRPQL